LSWGRDKLERAKNLVASFPLIRPSPSTINQWKPKTKKWWIGFTMCVKESEEVKWSRKNLNRLRWTIAGTFQCAHSKKNGSNRKLFSSFWNESQSQYSDARNSLLNLEFELSVFVYFSFVPSYATKWDEFLVYFNWKFRFY